MILSVLFDKDGVLRGIRMISDPRGAIMERRMAYMLRLAIIKRYEPVVLPADIEADLEHYL